MFDILEENDGKSGIGGRNITTLQFVIGIDGPAEEQKAESLNKACTIFVRRMQ